jgi:small-conductance mechanosensitive channel
MQSPATSLTASLVIAALIVVASVAAVVAARLLLGHILGRRWAPAADIAARCARPGYAVAAVLAVTGALSLPAPGEDGPANLGVRLFGGVVGGVHHILVLLTIVSITWLIVRTAFVVTRAVMAEVENRQTGDSSRTRRIRTQLMLIERLVIAVAVVIAVGAMLFTWPTVRALGAGLLASAGIAGIVLGIAAQTAIGNLFAGLQLAFGAAMRVGDVVVVERLWGEVEELTLTYVVVRVWDGRRLILPVSYFTKTPFENWTRRDGRILGTVFLRVDWTAPVDELRAHLFDILRDHPLWDRESWDLHVTDVEPSGLIELRAVMSETDGYASWDLCCDVRERLVAYLRDNHPEALPRLRVAEDPAAVRPGRSS